MKRLRHVERGRCEVRSCSTRDHCIDWMRSSDVFTRPHRRPRPCSVCARSKASAPLLHAEEHALVVVAPRQRRAIAHDPALGKRVRLRWIERDGCRWRRRVTDQCADVAVGHEHVFTLAHLVHVRALQHRDRRAVVVPRHAVVGLVVVLERNHPAVLEVEDEEAVAVLRRRIDRVSEELAGLVKRNVADTAEQLVAARCQVVNDDVNATWSSRRVRRGRRCGATAAARRWRAFTTRATYGRTRSLWRTTPKKKMRRVRRERERLNVLPRLDSASREVRSSARRGCAGTFAFAPRPSPAPAASLVGSGCAGGVCAGGVCAGGVALQLLRPSPRPPAAAARTGSTV